MSRRRAVAAILTSVLLGLGPSGCGGGGGTGSQAALRPVDATSYVTALCRAVGPFEHDAAAQHGALAAGGSPAAGKAALSRYLGALSGDSHRAVARLVAAGEPVVRGGRAFAAEILTTFRRLDRALMRSVGLAQQLPTSSPAAFRASAGTLATAVRQSISDLGAGLSTQANASLDRVAAKLPACHAL